MTSLLSIDELLERSRLATPQLAIYFGQKLHPDVPFFNMAVLLRLPDDISPDAFWKAIQGLVDRIDVLRTIVEEQEGIPQPRVLAPFAVAREEREFVDMACLRAWAHERVCRRIDVAKPMFDCVLARLPDRLVLFLNQHHLICDGLSGALLVMHFLELIENAKCGREDGGAVYPPYTAYAEWERAQRLAGAREDIREYWRRKLAEPVEPLTFYGRAGDALSTSSTRVVCELGADRSAGLLRMACDPRFATKSHHASVFNLLVATLFAWLHRVSGNHSLSVGMVHHNRPPAFRDTIGMFVGALPLHVTIAPGDTFANVVDKVRDEAIANRKHAQGVVMARRQERHYDVLVNYQLVPVSHASEGPLEPEWVYTGHSIEPLALQILHAQGGDQPESHAITLCFDFLDEVFGELERQHAPQHFLNLLDAFLAAPDIEIGEVDFLTAEECRWLVYDVNETPSSTAVYPLSHQYFEEYAHLDPARCAVRFAGQSLTYGELNAKANALAFKLQQLGVGPEACVGICMERSPWIMVAILAVSKSGGAFLPLDQQYPEHRLTFMLTDAGVDVLLTQEAFRVRFAKHTGTVICVDSELGDTGDWPAEGPPCTATPESTAYVIYTSGSTGQPKGTLLPHRGWSNLLAYQRRAFPVKETDRILQFASISFDMSIWDISLALGGGATLCLAQKDTVMQPSLLAQFIQEEGITVVTLPPTMMRMLSPEEAPTVHTVFCGGERCPVEVVNRWAPGRRFINAYGPTECTVAATVMLCQAPCQASPPIGHPLDNYRLYILDTEGGLCPAGVSGELYIGGPCVAKGYLNRPELTADRFLPDPFSDDPNARLYRTGDRVRYRGDGAVEFLGRLDDQIKVQGYRVELGEIEYALERQPGVHHAAVVARQDAEGRTRLAAYLEPERQATMDVQAVREALRSELPPYMMPASIRVLSEMPLNTSGKVDKKLLPEPEEGEHEQEAPAEPPRSELEQQLARFWCQALKRDTVSATASLFDLGGDSLTCIQITELARAEGIELVPTDLYRRPSVRLTAEACARQGGAGRHSAVTQSTVTSYEDDGEFPVVLPIIHASGKRPFFFVAPAGGVLFPYFNLVPYLDPARPVYGLQDPSLVDGHAPFETVESLAACYVEAMRAVQPDGPYLLGGWSFGGIVAYEMARQLHAAGERTAFLALMDTYAGVPYRLERFSLSGVVALVAGAARYFGWSLRHAAAYVRDGLYVIGAATRSKRDAGARRPSFAEFLSWIWMDAVHRYGLKQADVAGVVSAHAELLSVRQPEAYPILRVSSANIHALRRYRIQPYAGKMALFRAEEQPFRLGRAEDKALGWEAYVQGGVEVSLVPGNHVVLFRKPHIAVLGEALRAALEQADTEM